MPVEPTTIEPVEPAPPSVTEGPTLTTSPLSRRGFLRAAGVTGLAGVDDTIDACQEATNPQWSFGAAQPPA